jgi:hypothetical protein
MKRFTRWLVAVPLVAVAAPAFAAGGVRVRGHVRKDGTYVQPHYRTTPDTRFYNNWSTKGNYNPYTGMDGKVVTPPLSGGVGGYRLPAKPSYKPRLPSSSLPPYSVAQVTSSLGISQSPAESPSDLLSRYNRESHASAARRLRELGVSADPERESFLSMTDKESRVRAARRLRDLGHEVDWQTTSFLDLTDMESRIRASRRLQELGHIVDWKSHSFLDMTDIESRIRAARRLKDKGVDVDWEKNSFMQMIEMESHARRLR